MAVQRRQRLHVGRQPFGREEPGLGQRRVERRGRVSLAQDEAVARRIRRIGGDSPRGRGRRASRGCRRPTDRRRDGPSWRRAPCAGWPGGCAGPARRWRRMHKHARLVFNAHSGDASHAMGICQRRNARVVVAAACLAAACQTTAEPPAATTTPTAEVFEQLATRVDPYMDKTRVVVLTDIANEPDDQMSMVRFLVYANEFDIEGLVATTSTWMRDKVRPDVIRQVIDAYEKVQPTLAHHAAGLSHGRDVARALVTTGQPGFGMAAVGPGQDDARAPRPSSGPRTDRTTGRCGCSPGAARTRSPRRSCMFVRHADAERAVGIRLAPARLHDLRSGRRRAVDPARVPDPALHRHPVDASTAISTTWRPGRASAAIGSTGMPTAQTSRRSQTTGSTATSVARDRSASCTASVLHPRGRHAVVPGADQQRSGERHEPRIRRMGRAIRLAPVLRRDRGRPGRKVVTPTPAGRTRGTP